MALDFSVLEPDQWIAVFSAVGTIAAAVAAVASWRTSGRSLKLQKKLADHEQKKFLYESLKACAGKANAYASGKTSAEWTFHDAANIVRSMSLAQDSIARAGILLSMAEIKGFKNYFISLLNMELFEELNYGNAPDAIFRKTEITSIGSKVWSKWDEVIVFFDLKIATDEDLAD